AELATVAAGSASPAMRKPPMMENATNIMSEDSNCATVTRPSLRARSDLNIPMSPPYVELPNVRLWLYVAGTRYSHLMTSWEYATVPLIDHVTKQILDQWGDDGWELVQVVVGPTGGLVAYMKRPKGDA